MATACNFIKEAFNSCSIRKWIIDTAIFTGLVQCQRKVNIIYFFWTLMLSFETCTHKTIAELRRFFEQYSGVNLVPPAFYDRFTPRICLFVKKAAAHTYRLSEPIERLNGKLKGFTDRVIADSSVFKLHDIVEALVYAVILIFFVNRALLFKLRKIFGVTIDRTQERRWTRVSRMLPLPF